MIYARSRRGDDGRMDDLLNDITRWLIGSGPWLVFAMTLLETALFAGLLIPAEATVVIAGFLAYRGVLPLDLILLATFSGGLIGDQIGYFLGRSYGTRIVSREGRLGRLWRRYEPATVDLFRRHSMISITLARFLSFVRTLMPWLAGMSRIPYGRFLIYDLVGVAGWAAGSVAIGYLAGPSWRAATEVLGTATAVVFSLGILTIGLLVLRRSRQMKGRLPSVEGP